MPGQPAEILSSLLDAPSFRTFAVIAIPALFAAVLHWLNFSSRRWKLRTLKHKTFRQLLKNEAWRRASPYEFHTAMSDAFGRSLDPIEFAFIQTRMRPLELMNKRFAAGRWIRFDREKLHYHWVGKTAPAHRWAQLGSFSATLAGILLMSAAGTLGWFCISHRDWTWFFAAEIGAALAFAALVVGYTLDAAKQFSKWEEDHPQAQPMPDKLKPRKRIVPKRKKDSAPANA